LSPRRRQTPEAQFNADLRSLRDRAQAEIKLLDDERHALKRLVAFADQYLGKEPGGSLKRQRQTVPVPLTIIKEHPGIRSSMVAQLLQREVTGVASEIKELESKGQVRRDGLGWIAPA